MSRDPRYPPPFPHQRPPQWSAQSNTLYPVDPKVERTLAAAAHAAIVFGAFGLSLPVSLLISGVIWLYARRSPYVRYHSEQAGCYQCSVLLINILAVVVLALAGGFSIFNALSGKGSSTLSAALLVGIALFVLWFVVTILYGVAGAVLVLLGKPFQYPVIGNRIRK